MTPSLPVALAAITLGLGCAALAVWRVRVTMSAALPLYRLPFIKTVTAPQDGAPLARAWDVDETMLANHQPEPVTDLDRFMIANWQRLPAAVRRRCVAHLRAVVLTFVDGPELLACWQEQKRKGLRIGSDEWGFHFGTGMTVRNVLREVVKDAHLPPVRYRHSVMRNWDDYFYGCLDELAGSEP